MSPFFIEYRVCIIVNQHLSKRCNSLNTNSHKKKAKRQRKYWSGYSTFSQSVFINCHTVLNIVREIIPQNSTVICIEPTM